MRTSDDFAVSCELPTYRIRNSADVKAHFQAKLDKFPRASVGDQDRIRFSEFGAYFIRPVGEQKNQLTHLLFPETVIAVPNADYSLKSHHAASFPQVILLADPDTRELYVRVISHFQNSEGFIESNSLLLGMAEAFFLSDIWDAVSGDDKETLAENGFGPGMSNQEWAQAINNFQSHVDPRLYPRDNHGTPVRLRELPIAIARRGAVGTTGSFHFLPEFMLYAMRNNRFVYDEGGTTTEFGEIHIHSLFREMGSLQKAVADIVGEEVVRRTPSVEDFYHHRAINSIESLFRKINSVYGNEEIDMMVSFSGIITVNPLGKVTGARYFDYSNPDLDPDKLEALNIRAWKSIYESSAPSPKIIAEHYEYLDSLMVDDFGTAECSPHVGDPDYDR